MTTTETSLIEKRPGFVGGKAAIRGTRIPVWVIVAAWRMYGSMEKLERGWPGASRAGIEAALAYYETHRDEIDPQIARAQEPEPPSDENDDLPGGEFLSGPKVFDQAG